MRLIFWDTDRIVAIARLVLAAALSLALLLGMSRSSPLFLFLAFIFVVYFVYALAVLWWLREPAQWYGRLTLMAGDLAALVVVVLFAPELPAAFLVFFLYFSVVTGLWQGWKTTAGLSVLVSAGYLWVAGRRAGEQFSTGILTNVAWESWGVAFVLLVTGTLIGALAERERKRLEDQAVVDKFSSLLSLDTRWDLLWERFLRALCERYRAERAVLVYREPESGRIIVWTLKAGDGSQGAKEEDRPPRDAHMFLLEVTQNGLVGVVGNNGIWKWQLRLPEGRWESPYLFSLPERFSHEFMPGAVLSAPLVSEGDWQGRVFLLDHRVSGSGAAQLEDLHRLLEGLGPSLTTLLTVRGLIAYGIIQERERVVRELHDGIAQTLASVEMQLSVFRRTAESHPAKLSGELLLLQKAVGREREGFRRFLRELKPLRVPPRELAHRLVAHCAQFQQETGIAVDVEIDPLRDDVPEGICREVFLILRESLHNARKHSGAKFIRVRVHLDDDRISFTVEDDGGGFPFTGSYSHQELKEKRLAPVSLLERLEALGGRLHIESSAEAGAILRMNVPLN